MPDVSITPNMQLPEILSRYPACRTVFDRYGLVGCGLAQPVRHGRGAHGQNTRRPLGRQSRVGARWQNRGAGELAVVLTFALILVKTIRQSSKPVEPYERFIFAALGWMIAAFAFDCWIFAASATVSGYEEWVRFISQYDAAWRDVQLAGFAGGMILGVRQRFLPFKWAEGSKHQSSVCEGVRGVARL